MGSLFHIVAAVAVLALVEGGFARGAERPWLVLGLACVPHALALSARLLGRRGRFRASALLALAAHASPPFLFALAILACGWWQSVARWLAAPIALDDWPHPSLLAVLAPFAAYELLSIDACARARGGTRAAIANERRFHARGFVAAFAPIAIFVLVCWLVGLRDDVRVAVERIGVFGALFAALLLLGTAFSLPLVLRATWDTRSLPAGPERALLEATGARARFRCRDLLEWRTGGLVANAAIVGLTPGQRVVLLSDLLLAQLDARELAAVFAHEIGHARHRHVLIFGAWALGFVLAGDLLLSQVALESEAAGLALVLPFALAWFLGFGWLSRRFELEADLYSLELTGDGPALASALARVGGPERRSSWRHFSTATRVGFLQSAERDAQVGRGLRRKLGLLAWLGGLLFFAALALEVRRLALDWPVDTVVADLALGRYDSAKERLAAIAEPDADLERLVSLAAGLAREGTPLSVAELEHAARGNLAQGDRATARDLVELALVRGAALDLVAELLDDPRAADPERAARLDPAWREALAHYELGRARLAQ